MYGTQFRILADESKLASRVERLLDTFETTTHAARSRNLVHITGEPASGYTVFRDCARLCTDEPAGLALARTIAGLNSAVIETLSLFAVHSGVVGLGGRILAIPARSGDGKTTLTGSLVRMGFDYLSDEALIFEDDGTVLPYPKPLALSRWSAEVLGVAARGEETLVTASDLGGGVGEAGKLTDLIISEYGHEQMKLEPLPKSQAVASLIEYSFNHYKNPARAFRIATEVARDLEVWRLEYDDPIEAAQLIKETLS